MQRTRQVLAAVLGALLIASVAGAQGTGTIAGTVTADATGAPVAGARIFVAGTALEYLAGREEPFAGLVAPACTVVDLHYFQQITPRLRLLARAENVFDRRYSAFSLFAARAGNVPGQPRTISIALTVTSGADGRARRP